MIWVATADADRRVLGSKPELGSEVVTPEDLFGAGADELWIGSSDLDPDDELTAEDQLDEWMDALGVSELEVRPALRPRMEPDEIALLGLAGALVAASVVLWASTVAVIAAALVALP